MNKIAYPLILLVCITQLCIAQKEGQELIDSLLPLLKTSKQDTNKVRLLNKISYLYPYINPDEGIKYGNESLELAKNLNWTEGIAAASYAIGGNYTNKADYANALKYEYDALKIYEQLKDRPMQALMLRNLGIVHHTANHQDKALEYDEKALKFYQELNDKNGIAAMYNNMANVFNRMHQRDKVLEYDLKSLELYKETRDKEGTARMTGNIANFYADGGDFSKAMIFYFDALRKERALGNKNGITRNLGNIGETYFQLATDTSIKIKADSLIPATRAACLLKGLSYLRATIDGSKELKQTEYYLAFAEELSDAYKRSGNIKAAYDLYKEYIQVRDSVYDVEKLNAANRREMDYEYGKREDSIAYEKKIADVKLAQEKKSRSRDRIFYLSGIALVLIFSGFIFNRWKLTQLQKKIIEKEKQRSEELLLNILPSEVAEELKQKGSAEAKQFDEVTVMFTDFKNFTMISEKLSPAELVHEIDTCFKAFDNIVARFGIEKIKTIGDSYMCAGGLPVSNKTHATDVVSAALEIQGFMKQHLQERMKDGKIPFEIRIGIHTGPVVAGIVGIKKFAYDIWGDTVNIASRMESSGEAGKVNISGNTFALVKDKFPCDFRGEIEAKGKGKVKMYFVNQFNNNI